MWLEQQIHTPYVQAVQIREGFLEEGPAKHGLSLLAAPIFYPFTSP